MKGDSFLKMIELLGLFPWKTYKKKTNVLLNMYWSKIELQSPFQSE